jgi:hypothetical protein
MRFADLKHGLDSRLARRELRRYVIAVPLLDRDDRPLAKLAYDSVGLSLIDDSPLGDKEYISVDFLLPALMECDVAQASAPAHDDLPGVVSVALKPLSIFDLADHAKPELLPLWLTGLFRMVAGETA